MAQGRLPTRVRRAVRSVVGVLVVLSVLVGTAGVAPALDAETARRDLITADDFRLRVTAALYLGKSHAPGARESLEHALVDSHPAVRTAAALALSKLGDPLAVPALKAQAAREGSASAKAQMLAAVDTLEHGPAVSPSTKMLVKVGSMRNTSGIRGGELGPVLAAALKNHAGSLSGVVVGEEGSQAMRDAVANKVPILVVDGSITALTQGHDKGNVTYRAQVEFSVRKENSLRATLHGAATAYDAEAALKDKGRINRLEEDAVDGAVQSALRNATSGLEVAAR
jgi:hypothetical protein